MASGFLSLIVLGKLTTSEQTSSLRDPHDMYGCTGGNGDPLISGRRYKYLSSSGILRFFLRSSPLLPHIHTHVYTHHCRFFDLSHRVWNSGTDSIRFDSACVNLRSLSVIKHFQRLRFVAAIGISIEADRSKYKFHDYDTNESSFIPFYRRLQQKTSEILRNAWRGGIGKEVVELVDRKGIEGDNIKQLYYNTITTTS